MLFRSPSFATADARPDNDIPTPIPPCITGTFISIFPIKNDFIYFILCLAISKSAHSEHTLFKYSKSPSSLAVRLIGYYLLNSHSCFFQEHCITKKSNNLLSEWKVQDYILLILRIKEAELAELKCKMIFRLLCITEIPPLNHETVIVYIKAEDIIFCFYLF